jgi:hypothetical protein
VSNRIGRQMKLVVRRIIAHRHVQRVMDALQGAAPIPELRDSRDPAPESLSQSGHVARVVARQTGFRAWIGRPSIPL